MQSVFSCTCGQRFAAVAAAVAQQVRCPRCATVLLIPAVRTPPVARLVPPSPPSPRRSRVGLLLILLLVPAVAVGAWFTFKDRFQRNPDPIGRTEDDAPKDKPPPDEEKPAPPTKGGVADAVEKMNAARRAAGLAPASFDGSLREIALESTLSPPEAVEQWLGRPYPRLVLLDPRIETVNVVQQQGGAALMLSRSPPAAKSSLIVYPIDGQKHVPVGFPGNEVPDPIPQSRDKIAGYPVTATFPARTKIGKAAGRLLDSEGEEVPAWFSSPEQPANPRYRSHQGTSLCLIARDQLRHGAGYRVEMSAEIDGKAWSKTWSFNTTTRERESAGIVPGVIERINGVRQSVGLSVLKIDDDLSRACQAHAVYLATNSRRANLNFNDEDPALPGATPEGRRAAKSAHVSAAPFDPTVLVESWLSSFHFRFPLLDREARRIAVGCARGPRNWYAVVLLSDPAPSSTEALLYPAPDSRDVPLDYESGERPDPIPESKDRRAGFPIMALFPAGAKVVGVKADLSSGGKPVPFWLSTPEKPVADGYQRNTICLIARRALDPARKHTVRMSARVNGKDWEKTWSFQTIGDGDADAAPLAAEVVQRLNVIRRSMGLSPVAVDPELSRGCRLHARYLLLNHGHRATLGRGMHAEDAGLPGATDEGRTAGAAAVIADGLPPHAALDDWVATFYHRVPLLDPDLTRVGFGAARGGASGWTTVLDVTTGKGRDVPIVYPGSGQKDVPPVGSDGKGQSMTIRFAEGRIVRQVEVSLRDDRGTAIPLTVETPEGSQAAREANAVVAVPREQLRPETEYTVVVRARIERNAWTRTWTFRTGKSR